MRVLTALLIGLFALTGNTDAREMPLSGKYCGYLEDIYPVHFHFYKNEFDGISGFAYFPLTGDSTWIEVDAIEEGLMLTEFDERSNLVGYYLLEKTGGNWDGSWRNADGSIGMRIFIESCKDGEPIESLYRASDNKWLETYEVEGWPGKGQLLLFRQSGWSISAVLTEEKNSRKKIFLRGDCLDPGCLNIGLLSQSTESDLFVEVDRTPNRPSLTVFSSPGEDIYRMEKKGSWKAEVIYSFNKHFVFDAVIPDFGPLFLNSVEEQSARWLAESVLKFDRDRDQLQRRFGEKFAQRNYIWLEVVELSDHLISGYLEWISNDGSEAMKGFVFDREKNQFFLEEDLKYLGILPVDAEKSKGDHTKPEGVLIPVSGGYQYVSPLDAISGRDYRFILPKKESKRIPRAYRSWFK